MLEPDHSGGEGVWQKVTWGDMRGRGSSKSDITFKCQKMDEFLKEKNNEWIDLLGDNT